MLLFIEPSDVLLFRESKPFSAGEQFLATNSFPPSPIPFLGAIRAKVLSKNGISFNDYKRSATESFQISNKNQILEIVGTPNDYGKLKVKGMFLCEQCEQNNAQNQKTTITKVYFPAPLDLMEQTEKNSISRLKISDLPWDICQNSPSLKPLQAEEKASPPSKNLLCASSMKSYLEGTNNFSLSGSFWDKEIRVGIALSGKRTAEEGKIYAVEFIRMKTELKTVRGFIFNIEGLDIKNFDDTGVLALGGESRIANYKKLNNESSLENLERLQFNNLEGKEKFKIYLSSPAIFRNGWVPDFLTKNGDRYEGNIGSVEVELISATVGKAIPISGWDIVNNRPRKMWKAVPAGSVYFFKKKNGNLTSGDVQILKDKIHFNSLLTLSQETNSETETTQDLPLSEYGKAGLGLALLGIVDLGGTNV